jgi:hypothetical protein
MPFCLHPADVHCTNYATTGAARLFEPFSPPFADISRGEGKTIQKARFADILTKKVSSTSAKLRTEK